MRLWMDGLLLRVPVFGPLVEKATIARWTRTLSTLLAAGVSLAEALRFTGQASGNAVFVKANEAIEAEVRTGVGLTTAMQGAGVFTPMTLQIASIGEEAGSLDDMLGKVSDIYEAEVEEIIKNLSAIMEPAVIVMLALIFAPVLIAMYLPIFNLGNIF
jgi:type IV pilus assembly protein PilC